MTLPLQTVPQVAIRREFVGLSAKEIEHVSAVLEAVTNSMGSSFESLVSPKRTDRVCRARHVAMTILRESTNLSLMEIGEIFNRDHGTVIHAIKRVAGDDTLTAKAKELTPRHERKD